jgi:hypothetical protein
MGRRQLVDPRHHHRRDARRLRQVAQLEAPADAELDQLAAGHQRARQLDQRERVAAAGAQELAGLDRA